MESSSSRPSPAMIVAAVALVFALVGTAVAGPDAINRAVTKSTVKKIAKKQAKKQLRKNISGSHVNLADQATTADTANRANRADTADTATSADTANTANTATSADTANTANTATNADNAANAAALNGLSANQIRPLGRQAENTGCDPQTTTFVDCASVDLNLPSSGRVLLIADITWHSDVSPARGLCRLTVNGPQIGDTAFPGENLNVTDSIHEIGQGLNAVTGVLSPGVNAFRLQCNQEQGDIDYDEAWLSAVYIGAA